MRRAVAVLGLLLASGCSSDKFTYADTDAGDSGLGGSAGSTGGSSATGGTTATGGTSGTSTGGTSAGAEDCTNGVDDDGDGKADCADVGDCECLPQVLSGWQGPYVLTAPAVDEAEPAACPASAPTEVDVLGHVDAPDATCPSCSCGNPTGGCTQATIVAYGGASCTGSAFVTWTKKATDACAQTGISGTGAKSMGASVEPTGAKCPAVNSGQVSIPATRFVERSRLCSGALGSCSAGHCAPALAADERACVLGATSQQCPTGYSVQADLDTGVVVSDTRKCTGCTCSMSNQTCTGWKVAVGSACSGLGGNITPAGSCIAWTSLNVAAHVDSTGTVSATCTPAGGKPNGAVTTETVRLCCTS